MVTPSSDPGPPIRGLTYTMATVLSVITLLLGYAVLDVADAAPGVLTLAAAPPPPPTETPGTRTLPVVPQPTPSTSVGEPLPPLAGDAQAPTPDGVTRALRGVVSLPALADSALVVRDGQTGQVLFDDNGSQLRIPASTTKILSAAAVGQAFAADATLETVVRRGASDREIVLVAGGDSLINPGKGDSDRVAGRAGLADLSDQVSTALEKAGVDAVTLAVDESYAYGPGVAPTWDSGFRPSGITGAVAMLGLSSQRATGGRVGPADPVAAVRDLFARQLESRGIDVTLAPRERPSATTPPPATPTPSPTAAPTPSPTAAPTTGQSEVLGRIVSAPVRDQLALALTDSDNALTEILARQAAFRSGGGTTFADTGAWVVSQVTALGLDTRGVVLRDASGLSRENRVRADLLTRILVLGYDGQHPVLRRALDGLPIGGLTGTLDERFTGGNSDAAGRARAKTGTLTGANALAGSVVDDNGRLLVFAGMVAGAGTTEARAALDRFVATLASCGCR
ncbi:D-alanyl-D-alanine carboxypeptidase/D-alanyl-D-alanine-endopeptidase [Humibacillus xanthopallidus]|uniref:D-alanyl-D-alanine carboxypeptidase/D-alanyl-D-alanine-endopeptidase n=1 Tax=Humibacillus xanthopallidus TaxID=412689 RepID=UPI00384DA9B8